MNKIKNYNVAILLILVVATIGTLYFTISQRLKVENASNGIEMIFDYDKLLEIEDYEKTTMGEWLTVATADQEEKYSIALKSEYMEDFAKDKGLYYATVSATKNSLVSGLIDQKILDILNTYDEQAILIKTAKESDKDFLVNAFSFYSFLEVKEYDVNGDYYLIIDHGFNDALQFNLIPLGYSEEKVADIKNSGAKLCLRPLNYQHDPKGAFDLFVSEANKHVVDSKIVFFENEVIGFERSNPESVMLAADYIRDNNLRYQIVEAAELNKNLTLEGYDELKEELGLGYMVRMFSVWDFIASKYQYLGVYKGAEEIENTIFRAVSERNNRAVVLNIIRTKDNTKYITTPEVYTDMLTSLEERVNKQGLYFGDATSFEDYEVSRGLLYAMAIEVVLFVVVMLNMMFGNIGNKANAILTGIGVVGVIGLDVLSRGLFLNILSLAAGVTLSTIAVLYFVNYTMYLNDDIKTKKMSVILLNFIATILIALLGGLFIASFKSRTEFLLVFETFVGVKVSLLAPIGLLFVSMFIYFIKLAAKQNKVTVKDELVTTTSKFLNVTIKMYYVIIFGIVAVLGLLYLMRTGNNGAAPSSLEFLMRNFFENNMFARPRNKELFMAVPMMVVGIVFIKNSFVQKNIYTRFVFISAISMGAIIETTSIINTFSHRTPLDMSIYRTFAAVIMGIGVGLVYALCIQVFIIICKKINKKYNLVG